MKLPYSKELLDILLEASKHRGKIFGIISLDKGDKLTMVRQTSIESYTTMKSNGFLTGMQGKVYEVLANNGPLTQGEAWNEFLPTYQRHSVAPRFAELLKLGLIQIVGERDCRFSGVLGLTWDVTGSVLTEKPVKVSTKKFTDEIPAIVDLLKKIDGFLKTLPEGGMTEVYQYDISKVLEKLV